MKQFFIDWKFTVEDIIWNIKQIIPKFPVNFIETRQEYGNYYEIVKVEGESKEYKFKDDIEYENLEKIMEFMNKHLPDQSKHFVLITPGDDDYTYTLEKK